MLQNNSSTPNEAKIIVKLQELGLEDESLKNALYEYSKDIGPDGVLSWLESGASRLRQAAGNTAAFLEIAKEASSKGWEAGAGFSGRGLESILNLRVDSAELPGGFTPDGPAPDKLCGFQTSPSCDNDASCNNWASHAPHPCEEEDYRHIYEEGCACTVEDGSWCSDDDACFINAIEYFPMKDCSKAWH